MRLPTVAVPLGDPARLPLGGGRRLALASGVAATLIFATAVILHGGATSWTAFEDIAEAVAALFGFGACWWTGEHTAGRERLAWRLIGAGAGSWGAGQTLRAVLTIVNGHQPISPSVADIGFLLGPVLITLGLLLFVDTPAGALSHLRGIVEALLIAGGLMVAVWTVLLAPVMHDMTGTLPRQVITLAYPVLDTVALSALVFLGVRHPRHRYGSLPTLALGITSLAVADSAFWYDTTVRGHHGANLADIGWFAGFIIVGLAASGRRPALSLEPTELTVESADEASGSTSQHSWVVEAAPQLVGSTALAVTALCRLAAGAGRVGTPASWMMVALAALALADGLAVVVENHALTANLEGRVRDRTAQIAQRERRFAALVEHSSDIIAVVYPDFTIGSVSEGIHDAYGWHPADLVGRRLDSFGERFEVLAEALLAASATLGSVQHVAWELVDRSGRRRYAESDITNLVADPDVGGYVVNTHDVTERTLLEIELRHQAFHDDLSGLANRALFNDRAEHALVRAMRTGADVAVMVIDLDGFKDVNDSLGHEAGDALLRVVSNHLLSATRASDTVARLGGDEFGVLMEDLSGPAEALETAERLAGRLRQAAMVDNADFRVTASIGVATSGRTATSVSSLLRDADIAMYAAKRAGKDAVRLFQPSMHDEAKERFQLQSELKAAIDRGEFTLYYQPSFLLKTGELEGFEALVRWEHPILGLIPPDRFIPLAEETGLIVPLGRWVLWEATRQLAAWQSVPGAAELTMAINISARQMREVGLAEDIGAAIAAAGLTPGQIVIEVTEGTLIHNSTEVASILHRLKATGVRIAIDDFGTGYSSLSYLQDLPIDILKIDKAFVSPTVARDDDSPSLVGAILNLARTLGLSSVAEGIERPEQLALLETSGCDTGQGFLWAPPLTADDAWTVLTTVGARNYRAFSALVEAAG